LRGEGEGAAASLDNEVRRAASGGGKSRLSRIVGDSAACPLMRDDDGDDARCVEEAEGRSGERWVGDERRGGGDRRGEGDRRRSRSGERRLAPSYGLSSSKRDLRLEPPTERTRVQYQSRGAMSTGGSAKATTHDLSTGGSDDFCAALQWTRVTHRLACRPACRGTSLSPPSSRRVAGGSRPRAETTCPTQASLLVVCQGCARGTRLPRSSRCEPVVDCSPVDPTRRSTASRGRACASRACTEASGSSPLSGERAGRVWVEGERVAE
jgi:hypothetical protein